MRLRNSSVQSEASLEEDNGKLDQSYATIKTQNFDQEDEKIDENKDQIKIIPPDGVEEEYPTDTAVSKYVTTFRNKN